LSSSDEPLPLAWLGPIAERLDALEVDWVVAGALAALRYRSDPRFTTDLDLLVRWRDGLDLAFLDRFEVRVHRDLDDHPHLLMLRSSDEKIDLIVAVVPYQEQAIERGLAEHTLTVEDVIVHKLIAWRPRDRDDIASILAAGHVLDVDYLEHWAREWDVLDRWRRAVEPPLGR
jgi:hypothetical protein